MIHDIVATVSLVAAYRAYQGRHKPAKALGAALQVMPSIPAQDARRWQVHLIVKRLFHADGTIRIT